jgi:hypothetical protein
MLTPFVYRRPRFSLLVDGAKEYVPFNNPTAMAVASLCANSPYRNRELDDFLEAGGIPTLLRALCKTRCPLTTRYAVHFIEELITTAYPPRITSTSPPKLLPESPELADKLCQAGAGKRWPQRIAAPKNCRRFNI